MKNKTAADMTSGERIEFINGSIVEWYQLFAAEYPKNRQTIFDILDEGAKRSPRPKVREFWANLKDDFLEVEKTF